MEKTQGKHMPACAVEVRARDCLQADTPCTFKHAHEDATENDDVTVGGLRREHREQGPAKGRDGEQAPGSVADGKHRAGQKEGETSRFGEVHAGK